MLPDEVLIREVGPRDGFQNEREVIPTEAKVRLIERLARTGLRRLEVTSFVRADVIPQLADADEVLARIGVPAGVSLSVLVPNERGLDGALRQRSLPRDRLLPVRLRKPQPPQRRARRRGIARRSRAGDPPGARRGPAGEAVISVSFGCPYEGVAPPQRVNAIARRLIAAGAQEIGFGDTTGMANPAQVGSFFAAARTELGDEVELTAHFHNTRGQGLAKVLAALGAGRRSFESSFGELGGCPVPPGATGNITTEDLVSMLEEMGIATGVSLERVLAAAAAAREVLGRPLGSQTLLAGPIDWHR